MSGPFRVFQEGGALTALNSHCVSYPVTDTMSSDAGTLAASLDNRWWFAWANRCTAAGNQNNNPPGARYKFTTVERADNATLAQLLAALNSLSQAYTLLGASGVTPLRAGDDPAAMPQDSNGNFIDVCNLTAPPAPPGVTGVALDYEVCDDRSPAQAMGFLGAYAKIARSAGWKSKLYTNALNSPCAAGEGINKDTTPLLLRLFDFITISADASPGSAANLTTYLRAQLDLVAVASGADRAKVIATTQIGGMNNDMILAARQFVINQGLMGFGLWAGGADLSYGGSGWTAVRALVNG